MQIRPLDSSRPLAIPSEPFDLDGPFAVVFARTRIAPTHRGNDDKQPTATEASSTGGDGSSPNPGSNEELDWEIDD